MRFSGWTVWEDRIDVLGQRHPDTLKSLEGLIEALRSGGDVHEAEQLRATLNNLLAN